MGQQIDSRDMAPAMALALSANFGSVEGWRAQFVAMGEAGKGVSLCFRPADGTLVNLPGKDRPEGVVPLHAGDIEWPAVYERYQQAVTAASEPFGIGRDALPPAALLDVRRAAMLAQDGQLIPGATWQDPAAVGQWGPSLPRDKEVVVYCVYGHEVGRATAMRLRAQGVTAWFLRGGIDGWKAAGLPLADKSGVVNQ